jgi:hypothetical protein
MILELESPGRRFVRFARAFQHHPPWRRSSQLG